MVRFLLLSLMVTLLAGCKSRSAVVPAPTMAPIAKVRPAPKEITQEQAVEIVRQRIGQESPNAVFNCRASKASDGFDVFVEFGSERDENGQLIGLFPGGHCFYKLSKSGEITRVVGGA